MIIILTMMIIGQFVGQTSPTVIEAVRDAMGGCLFIDEANKHMLCIDVQGMLISLSLYTYIHVYIYIYIYVYTDI